MEREREKKNRRTGFIDGLLDRAVIEGSEEMKGPKTRKDSVYRYVDR